MQEIANDIFAEQTPKRLYQVRGKVYELLINVVPPELIMRQLTQELLRKMDDEVKHQARPVPKSCLCVLCSTSVTAPLLAALVLVRMLALSGSAASITLATLH